MVKTNKRIEIVSSSQPGLSSMGHGSREGIRTVLAKHYSDVVITLVNNMADLEALVIRKPDLVFLGMKFIPENSALGSRDQNKIWISEFLDKHDIPFTGSGQSAHELELNKASAKAQVQNAGLATSAFILAKYNVPLTNSPTELVYPLFIKPNDRGGGVGIDEASVVHDHAQLLAKIGTIANELESDALIEEYLPGREFSVAILKHEFSDEFSTLPLELIAPIDKHGDRLLTAKVKSADSESFLIVTDEDIKTSICTLALDVFQALGARDYGRIDIRLDAAGAPHFLEANLIPSLLDGYGNFPKACLLNLGLSYEQIIMILTRLAFSRAELKEYEETFIPSLSLSATSMNPVFEAQI